MAMNFKIFNDKEALSAYTADLLRKQVNSNPESVLALQSHQELEWTFEKFVGEAKLYSVDFSQIYISTINSDADVSVLNNLPIPKGQLFTSGKASAIEQILDHRKRVNLALLYLNEDGKVGFNQSSSNEQLFAARELIIAASGESSAKEIKALYDASLDSDSDLSKIKSHRMVTVALDKDAASELDEDVVEYYSYQFA
jgi:hypothetical protein